MKGAKELFLCCMVVLVIATGTILVLSWSAPTVPNHETLPLSTVQRWIKEGRVGAAELFEQDQIVVIETSLGRYQATFLEGSSDHLEQLLIESQTQYEIAVDPGWSSSREAALWVLFWLGLTIVTWYRFFSARSRQHAAKKKKAASVVSLEARKKILQTSTRWQKLDRVDLDCIAHLTDELTAGQVASVPKKAARFASRSGLRKVITGRLLEWAAISIDANTPNNGRFQAVAVAHESGHALIAHLSPYRRLIAVTTISRVRSDGVTCAIRTDDKFESKESIIWEIALFFAGREAEIRLANGPHSGSNADIGYATQCALRAVCQEAMFDCFLERINIGNWMQHPRSAEISKKVHELLEEGRQKAIKLLNQNDTLLQAIFKTLQQKQFLYRDDIAALATASA